MNLEAINVNVLRERGEILTQLVVLDLEEQNVMKTMIVQDNWHVRTMSVSILAAHCLVEKKPSVFLRDMLPGVDAKVDTQRTRTQENVLANVKA